MSLNRRAFLKTLVGGIAATAVAEVIPLGRVWSFPSKIVIPNDEFVIQHYTEFFSISDLALKTSDPAVFGMIHPFLVYDLLVDNETRKLFFYDLARAS